MVHLTIDADLPITSGQFKQALSRHFLPGYRADKLVLCQRHYQDLTEAKLNPWIVFTERSLKEDRRWAKMKGHLSTLPVSVIRAAEFSIFTYMPVEMYTPELREQHVYELEPGVANNLSGLQVQMLDALSRKALDLEAEHHPDSAE